MKNSTILRSAALLGAVVILSVAALNVGGVDAARGGKHGATLTGGGTTGITLDQADPHLGDSVTFTTTGGGSRITVACYQDGVGVAYAAEQPIDTAFLLGGGDSLWQSRGGDALCYAWLYTRNLSDGFLAATSFVAGGAR
jgi:hypothetical protein